MAANQRTSKATCPWCENKKFNEMSFMQLVLHPASPSASNQRTLRALEDFEPVKHSCTSARRIHVSIRHSSLNPLISRSTTYLRAHISSETNDSGPEIFGFHFFAVFHHLIWCLSQHFTHCHENGFHVLSAQNIEQRHIPGSRWLCMGIIA